MYTWLKAVHNKWIHRQEDVDHKMAHDRFLIPLPQGHEKAPWHMDGVLPKDIIALGLSPIKPRIHTPRIEPHIRTQESLGYMSRRTPQVRVYKALLLPFCEANSGFRPGKQPSETASAMCLLGRLTPHRL